MQKLFRGWFIHNKHETLSALSALNLYWQRIDKCSSATSYPLPPSSVLPTSWWPRPAPDPLARCYPRGGLRSHVILTSSHLLPGAGSFCLHVQGGSTVRPRVNPLPRVISNPTRRKNNSKEWKGEGFLKMHIAAHEWLVRCYWLVLLSVPNRNKSSTITQHWDSSMVFY